MPRSLFPSAVRCLMAAAAVPFLSTAVHAQADSARARETLSALVDSAALVRAVSALAAPELPQDVPPLYFVLFDTTGAAKEVKPVFDHLVRAEAAAPVTAAIRANLRQRPRMPRSEIIYLRVDAGAHASVARATPRWTMPELTNRSEFTRLLEAALQRQIPRLSALPQVDYPVMTRFRVTPTGEPEPGSVSIARSSGQAALDSAAAELMMRTRFRAATMEGIPVAAWVVQRVVFRLPENEPRATNTASVPSIDAGKVPVSVDDPRVADSGRTNGPVEKWIGVDLFTSALDAQTADGEGVGTRGWGMQVNFGLTALQVLTARVDLGLVALRDERRFTQETNLGDQTSGVAGGMATVAAGLRTPPVSFGPETPVRVAAGAGVGHSWIDANRTIANCIDCDGENVSVDGGNFWEAGLQFDQGGRSGIAVRYRAYLGEADIRDGIMVGWNRRF